MSDIVEDLREEIAALARSELDNPMLGEAAAEIERLRIEVANRAHIESELQKERDRLRELLREREDEIRKLTGELHRVKLDRLDGAKRIRDLLAEVEQLRAHIAKLDAWQAKGEVIIAPATQWGPGGNVMVQSSVLFKLGAWWADRPWRVRGNPQTSAEEIAQRLG